MKQYPVRYGRYIRVVIAIVLPCFIILPFIEVMQLFKPLEDWLAYVLIYAFLACLIFFVLRLVKIIYPPAVLSVGKKQLNIRFTAIYFLRPADFTIHVSDIKSFTCGNLGDAEYMRFETQSRPRKFQLSARSSSEMDLAAFKEALIEVSEMINACKLKE